MKQNHSNATQEKQPVLLQVLPSLHSGGVERGTIDVTKAAIKAGFKVIVASAGGYMTHQVVSSGGVHVTLPLVNRNPIALWRNKRKLQKVIKEYGVDIVHARSRGPAWSGYFAAKKMGIPFVTTMHGNHSTSFPFKKLYNKIMTKGQRVIAISEFIRDHMIKEYHTDPSKITVIPRGVDVSQFDTSKVTERRLVQMIDRLRLPEDKYIVLLPGRLTRWKGQNVLLEALKYLPKKDVFCVLLGDDEKHPAFREELRRTILSEGLSPHVTIIGNVNDMPAAYRLANVVLSTSVRPEAFGRVPAEAGAMEKITIAPNHGGAQEIIEDGKTGWLIEPNNAKVLAEAIKKALSLSDKERLAIGAAAKERVNERFTVEKMCADTIALYRDVLAGKEQVIEPEVEEIWQDEATVSLDVSEQDEHAAEVTEKIKGKESKSKTEKKVDFQAVLLEDKAPVKADKKKKPAAKAKTPAKKKATTAKKPVANKPAAKKAKSTSVDDKPKKRGRPKKQVS